MRGISRILGTSFLFLGVLLPSSSSPLQGQTAEELKRVEELRQREHEIQQRIEQRLLEVREERQIQVEEVLALSRAQLQEAREQMRDQERKIRQLVVNVRGRARLGVSMNGSQGEELDRQGVRIEAVMADTPAEEAGLQEGDVITHLNGQALADPIPGEEDEDFDESGSLPVQRLISMAGDLDAGDEVEIRYLRDGEGHSVTVAAAEIDEPSVMVFGGELGDLEGMHLDLTELGELKGLRTELKNLYVDSPRLRIMSNPEGSLRGYTVMGGESPMALRVLGGTLGHGLKVTNLNPGLAEYFSTDSGLLVLEVDDDSATALLAGDVILAIDGREVEEQGDLVRILNSYEDDEVISFLLVRKGQQVEVEGRIR